MENKEGLGKIFLDGNMIDLDEISLQSLESICEKIDDETSKIKSTLINEVEERN